MKRAREDSPVRTAAGSSSCATDGQPSSAAAVPVAGVDLFNQRTSPVNPIVFFDLASEEESLSGGGRANRVAKEALASIGASGTAGCSGSGGEMDSTGSRQPRRLKIELYAHLVPKTAENFRQLCTGEHLYRELPLGFKGIPFHRVIAGIAACGGDVLKGDGSETMSIYGTFFDDENLTLSHDSPGIVTMQSTGKDRNGSQFMILSKAARELDGRHVVVGRVLLQEPSTAEAFEWLISTFGTGNGSQTAGHRCVIVQCGEM